MHLSQNFTLREFIHSPTADRLKLNNTPPAEAVANLRSLCEHVLQPLRDHYGQPVRITSGYRCEALNAAVGGASRSQHMTGQAADFIIPGVDLDAVYAWCCEHLAFDKLIREPTWLHVSWSEKPRGQAWKIG